MLTLCMVDHRSFVFAYRGDVGFVGVSFSGYFDVVGCCSVNFANCKAFRHWG